MAESRMVPAAMARRIGGKSTIAGGESEMSIAECRLPNEQRLQRLPAFGTRTFGISHDAAIILTVTDPLPIRPRRLRLNPQIRRMLQRVSLRRSDIIVPVFVTEGSGV